jgi:hypothetical protein
MTVRTGGRRLDAARSVTAEDTCFALANEPVPEGALDVL